MNWLNYGEKDYTDYELTTISLFSDSIKEAIPMCKLSRRSSYCTILFRLRQASANITKRGDVAYD